MEIRCAIIDDDIDNINMLSAIIDSIFEVNVTKVYQHPNVFLKELKQLKKTNTDPDFDFCIIDYHLPETNGIACVQQLENVKCILTSPESLPADELYNLEQVIDAIRITKPIDATRLRQAIKKVRDEILSERGYVVFKMSGGYHQRFELEEIVCIKNTKRAKNIFINSHVDPLKTVSDIYTETMLNIKLPSDTFCWVNDDECININYFSKEVEDNKIELDYPNENEIEKQKEVTSKIVFKQNLNTPTKANTKQTALSKMQLKIGKGKGKRLYKMLGIPFKNQDNN
jgi:CheY-like chemotaxis protein